MHRREILKFSLLSPLLGLFKSRKSGASTGLTKIPATFSGIMPVSKTDICNEALEQIGSTTATSSEGPTTAIWSVWSDAANVPAESLWSDA